MPRERSPNRDKAYRIWLASDKSKKLKDIAAELEVSETLIRKWKNQDNWNGNVTNQMKGNVTIQNKKQGAPPGNKNAVGHGAPKGNQNAKKHGLFSRYLPQDTLEIFNALGDADPLDLLWDQILLAYTSILRAQQIMYVKDQNNKTKSKIEKKRGNVSGEKWEIQYAWDKQASFLQAQAKAQSELRSMIKQYDELLHKNWELATDERRARIEQMKANAERLKRGNEGDDEDEGVEIINDAPQKASEDIRDSNTEVSADIQ